VKSRSGGCSDLLSRETTFICINVPPSMITVDLLLKGKWHFRMQNAKTSGSIKYQTSIREKEIHTIVSGQVSGEGCCAHEQCYRLRINSIMGLGQINLPVTKTLGIFDSRDQCCTSKILMYLADHRCGSESPSTYSNTQCDSLSLSTENHNSSTL